MKILILLISFAAFVTSSMLIKPGSSSLDRYFFEFFLADTRGFIADVMWLKVDQYHHTEKATADEIVSLCRLVTKLDPTHCDAYVVGSHMLSRYLDNPAQALAYLNQGIGSGNNNPDIDKLHAEKGFLLLFYMNDLSGAQVELLTALKKYRERTEPSSFHMPANYLRMLYIIASVRNNSRACREITKKIRSFGIESMPDQATVRRAYNERLADMRDRFKPDNLECPVCGESHNNSYSPVPDEAVSTEVPSDKEKHTELCECNEVKNFHKLHGHSPVTDLSKNDYPLHSLRTMPFQDNNFRKQMPMESSAFLLTGLVLSLIFLRKKNPYHCY